MADKRIVELGKRPKKKPLPEADPQGATSKNTDMYNGECLVKWHQHELRYCATSSMALPTEL